MERRNRDGNRVERVTLRDTAGDWEDCRHDNHRYFPGLFTAGSPRPRPLVTDSPKILMSCRLGLAHCGMQMTDYYRLLLDIAWIRRCEISDIQWARNAITLRWLAMFFPMGKVSLFPWTFGGTEVSQCNGNTSVGHGRMSRMASNYKMLSKGAITG
jgi:hypothetical protein